MSKIKNSYKVSKLSEDDLLEIFLKGIEDFGIKKAQKYSQAIDKVFSELAEFPDIGKLSLPLCERGIEGDFLPCR